MSLTIQLRDVTKHYKSVSVTIPNCDINHRVTLLQGHNGSGKSTLLKALMGWIHIEGEIVSNATYAYMPEHPSFPQDITVKTFLDTLENSAQEQSSLLALFRLEHKQDDYIHQLSKGMKAKLNIIQCVLMKRDIYLLDEPFNGLDLDGVQQLIQYINSSSKMFLITTHIESIKEQLKAKVITLD